MKKIYFGLLVVSLSWHYSCKKQTESTEDDSREAKSLTNVHAELVQLNPSMYYWSGGKKIPLSPDSTGAIFLIDDTVSAISTLRESNKNSALKRLRSEYYFAEGKQKLDLTSLTKGARNVQYVFKTSDNYRLVPTGEIVVQPNPGVDINTLLSKSGAEFKIKSKSKYGAYVVMIKNKLSLLDVANKIYESGLVEFSHPNFIADLVKTSDDPLFNSQYYLVNTGQTGGASGVDVNSIGSSGSLYCGIKVAVIDDGVGAHEELAGRLLPGFTPYFPSGLGAPTSSGAHGQACAGIVAASRDNFIGISGIAPRASIIPINIFQTSLSSSDVAAAIDWAWDEGQADVLSNSWGYGSSVGTDDITQAITRARTLGRGGKGAVVVFASGNGGGSVTFPANVNGVVAVGAVDKFGAIWYYSSRGPELDLVAPSGDVGGAGDVVTIDRMGASGYTSSNYYNNFGGTSAACPQVSGAAAYLLSINPNFTESQIVTYLRSNASNMGPAGFDNTFGYGRLNVGASMSKARLDLYSIVPVFNDFGRVCVNIPESTQQYSINVPPGATVQWSVVRLNIIGSSTSSTVTINGNPAYTSGTGRVSVTVTMPNCGSLTASRILALKNDCL